MMSSGRNRFPFTASQWEELEHQALIFKYMVSGMPIPPDLLFTIKRSLDSSISSNLIIHHPQNIGWNCFQMGFGRKIDPEPGRCKRTDGKKWRCSKEAYPDSKYCERHMHRGRNRSRKPVEVMTTTKTTNTSTIPISSITKNSNPSTFTHSNSTSHCLSSLSSIASDNHYHNHSSCNSTPLHHPFLYPHSSSSRPPGIGFSSQDYRNSYGHGMKEEVDEHAFFSENSATVRSMSGSSAGDSWHIEPLTMGSSSFVHSKQSTCSVLQSGFSYTSKQDKQDQHFCVLGSDAKCEMALKMERVDEPQKVMHHFFDEWPPNNKDSWVDSEDQTHLSISIPKSSHDFFMTHK